MITILGYAPYFAILLLALTVGAFFEEYFWGGDCYRW